MRETLLLEPALGSRHASGAPIDTEIYGIAPDGAILQWVVHTPTSLGPWPAVLLIHGGYFYAGGPTEEALSAAADDLAERGYLALAITYRLDKWKILKQTSNGRFPQQTNDCKMAVRAARADSRSNRLVGIVGGSAGACHGVLLAGTGSVGDDRPDVVVGLSGPYQFSDFDDRWNPAFTSAVTDYCNCTARDTDILDAASPAMLPTLAGAAPMLLIASSRDPMPPRQLPNMLKALQIAGNQNSQSFVIPGDQHAFDYWPIVRHKSIAFLDAVLKS